MKRLSPGIALLALFTVGTAGCLVEPESELESASEPGGASEIDALESAIEADDVEAQESGLSSGCSWFCEFQDFCCPSNPLMECYMESCSSLCPFDCPPGEEVPACFDPTPCS